MKKVLRIGMIEDDTELSELISEHLSSYDDISCEIVADSVENFIRELKEIEPLDIVLSDIQLPGMTGLEGIRLLKGKYPEMDFIVITVYHDSDKIFEALRSGASGYLLKSTPLEEIHSAILELASGGSPMSPQIARMVVEHFSPKKKIEKKSNLNEIEIEIVDALVNGLSYKMIADFLDISIDSVRYHIKHIYAKLHVHSKSEVISKSFRGEI